MENHGDPANIVNNFKVIKEKHGQGKHRHEVIAEPVGVGKAYEYDPGEQESNDEQHLEDHEPVCVFLPILLHYFVYWNPDDTCKYDNSNPGIGEVEDVSVGSKSRVRLIPLCNIQLHLVTHYRL